MKRIDSVLIALLFLARESHGDTITADDIQARFPLFNVVSNGIQKSNWHHYSISGDIDLYWRFLRENASYPIIWQSAVNSTKIQFIATHSHNGWFGVGFGASNMYYADVALVQKIIGDDTYRAYDAKTMVGPYVYLDANLPNAINDIVTDQSQETDSSVVVMFTRPLNTGDSYNYVIKPGRIPCVSAWSESTADVQVHGALHHTKFLVDLFRDEPGYENMNFGLPDDQYPRIKNRSWLFVLGHGVTMLTIFLVIIPAGLYVARFWLDPTSWLVIHQVIMALAISETVTVAAESLVTGSLSFDSAHSILGTITASTGLFVGSLGTFSNMHWEILRPYSTGIRFSHKMLGRIFAIAGLVNVFLGLQLAFTGFYMTNLIAAAIFVGTLGFTVTALFMFHRVGGLHYFTTLYESYNQKLHGDTLEKRSQSYDLQQKLPRFTMQEFDFRVRNGEQWLIVDGVIYAMAEFMHVHPGGSHLITQYIGKDASSAFNQTKTNKASGHVHSRLAKYKLHGLAVATVSESKNVLRNAAVMLSQKLLDTETSYPITSNPSMPRTIEKISAVVTKFQIASQPDATCRVYDVAIKLGEQFGDLILQPGHVFTVSLPDCLAMRHYTPLEMVTHGTVQFLIKIHNGGALTPFLEQQALSYAKSGKDFMVNLEGGPWDHAPQHPMKTTLTHRTFVLYSAGTGMTASLAILDAIATGSKNEHLQLIIVIASHASRADAQVYRDRLAKYNDLLPSIQLQTKYMLNVREEVEENEDVFGKLENSAQLTQILGDINIKETMSFICGPPSYMDDLERYLITDLQVPKVNVYCDSN